MNKKETIDNLRAAKSYLVQWKASIQGYAYGMPVNRSHLPLVSTDSLYSKWFLSYGQSLNILPSYKLINRQLEICFANFQELYKIIEDSPKKAGLFQSKAKLEKEREELIARQAQHVFESINLLIDYTLTLEKEALELTDEEFAELY